MKKLLGLLLTAAVGFACGTPVLAETQSETVFQHKNWKVEIVGWDDGTFACLAEVDQPNENFSIWTYQDDTVKLQFYSSSWDFGDTGDTANLKLQIDRRSPWTLTAADLYKNSVLFNLPDSDEGVKFLVEVASGSRLYLNAEDGTSVQNYSLAGSSASMRALGECSSAIKKSTNPFKK